MKPVLKPIPKFNSEDEERNFWDTHEALEYFDWTKAQPVLFPNLKLTRTPISLRLSGSLLTKIKLIANKKDLPYQSLIKHYLNEAVDRDYPKTMSP
jgi:predicted DNA binding CopG/RHH family protein